MADIQLKPQNEKSRRTRRSTRVDLTPMVDLGFLLITFFVFTTSLSQPTAMAMYEPHEGESLTVPESGAMTLIIAKNHRVFYYYGNNNAHLAETSLNDLRAKLVRHKKQTPAEKLMIVIKTAAAATLGDNINLLDEMAICSIPLGHYAEVPLSPLEMKQTDK